VTAGLEEQLSELGTAAGVDVSLRRIDADVL
jgi:hypothetical protein